MSEKMEDLVSTLAVHCQRAEDRLEATEDLFRNSMVVPESKMNAILITMILIILMMCLTFAFIWFLDAPI